MKTAFAFLALTITASAAEYPVAFLAYPKTTGYFNTQSVSQNNGPYVYHVGTDLVIADPDGTERVLVKGQDDAAGFLAVHDFCISLDGQSIIYAHIRKYTDKAGVWCDLFRVDVVTGETTQLTDAIAEWNPPNGAAQFAKTIPATDQEAQILRTTQGIHFQSVWNIAPCVCGDGSIVFCSNREAVIAPADVQVGPGFQLFRMAVDGKYPHLIGHLNLAGALHPSITRSGQIHFSSMEQQGGRTSNGNGWGTWVINPDGSDWGPEISAIGNINPIHFQTETSNGSLVAAQYYDTRIYGVLRVAPVFVPDPFGPPTKFGSPLYGADPPIVDGQSKATYSYQRRGFYTPLPMMWLQDKENLNAAGEKPGMVSHPAAIPGNGVLLTWTGDQGDLAMNLGIYSMPDITQPMTHHSQLIKVVDNPDRHEWMARPVVPFSAIYGIEKPSVPKGLVANTLPPASPFAIVSTSSMAWPEIVTGAAESKQFDNFTLDEAQYIRVLGFNKSTTYNAYGFYGSTQAPGLDQNFEGFHSAINERTGSYGEVPLHKFRKPDGTVHYGPNPPAGSEPILDPEGKPDTSFRIEIPANQPWTFQVLNSKKEAVGTAQTWHQLIPGEFRTCGGCHTHWQKVPFSFEQSFAATPEYLTQRLDKIKLAVWGRDIKPIVDKYALSLMQFAWQQGVKFYNSDDTTVDDDPRFTQAEAEMIRLWIDTGMMSEGKFRDYKTNRDPNVERDVIEADRLGPYADTQPPTITHRVYADKIAIGMFDPQAGINSASLSVTCTSPIAGKAAGEELAGLFTRDGDIWTLATAVPEGDLTISVRDNQIGSNLYAEAVGEGNLTKITVPLIGEGETPPDSCTEEIARLNAEIAALKQQIEALNAKVASWEAWYQTGGNN